MKRWALACLIGLSAAASATPARGQVLGRTSFADRTTGLRLFLPPKWVAQARSDLPGLVAAFRHPLGARLILSAQRYDSNEPPGSLAAKQTTLLRRQKWTVKTPTPTTLGPVAGVQVEATDASGKTTVFQIYAAHEKHTIVLTLSVPASQSARLLADLRFITRTARFVR